MLVFMYSINLSLINLIDNIGWEISLLLHISMIVDLDNAVGIIGNGRHVDSN